MMGRNHLQHYVAPMSLNGSLSNSKRLSGAGLIFLLTVFVFSCTKAI